MALSRPLRALLLGAAMAIPSSGCATMFLNMAADERGPAALRTGAWAGCVVGGYICDVVLIPAFGLGLVAALIDDVHIKQLMIERAHQPAAPRRRAPRHPRASRRRGPRGARAAQWRGEAGPGDADCGTGAAGDNARGIPNGR